MSDNTKIEWTDATINVINGCTIVSPGCTNCYAMKQAHRFPVRQGLTRKTKGGMVWTGEVRFHEPALAQVLAWKRPRKIFWNAHGDTFHEKVPVEWIDRCFAVMAATPQHIHQVLTKRPERMRRYMADIKSCLPGQSTLERVAIAAESLNGEGLAVADLRRRWPLPNVWLGVSVEDQQRADERIPILLDTPAAIRWLSMEPLLGPVDLSKLRMPHALLPRSCTLDDSWAIEPLTGRLAPVILTGPSDWALDGGGQTFRRIDWVVLGGESGPHARPMHPAWERAVRAQCEAAGVPYLFKQWGEWGHPRPPIRMASDPPDSFRKITACMVGDRSVAVHQFPNGETVCKVGKKLAGRAIDGRTFDGYPA